MYNSAPAISLDLTEASKEEEMEGGERGESRTLHTREVDVRHRSARKHTRKTGRDGEKPTDGQTEAQHTLTTLLFNVSQWR